jgi:hypothetical protein
MKQMIGEITIYSFERWTIAHLRLLSVKPCRVLETTKQKNLNVKKSRENLALTCYKTLRTSAKEITYFLLSAYSHEMAETFSYFIRHLAS